MVGLRFFVFLRMTKWIAVFALFLSSASAFGVDPWIKADFWLNSRVTFTNLIEPSRSMEILVEGSASSVPDGGEVAIELPDHVTYRAIRVVSVFGGASEEAYEVETEGTNVTVKLKRTALANRSSFKMWLSVVTDSLKDLPFTAPTWSMPLSMRMNVDGKIETLTEEEQGAWLYTRLEMTAVSSPSEVSPGDKLRYRVQMHGYLHGQVTRGSLGVKHPRGTDVIQDSVSGVSAPSLWPNSLAYMWNSPPATIDLSFEVKVRDAIQLEFAKITEFAASTSYTLTVEVPYGGSRPHKRVYIANAEAVTLPLEGQGSDELIVNSTADRGRKAGANGCDTGEKLTNGDPECTLRAAIEAVNSGNTNPIQFDIESQDVPVIFLRSALPAITSPVVIDGSTQRHGRVLIRGNSLEIPGLDVRGGNSTLKNLVIHGYKGKTGTCIRLSEKGENKVLGCYLGTDVGGKLSQEAYAAVYIVNCADNKIGGAGDEGNVLTGKAAGVLIDGADAHRNAVQGNRIGLTTDSKAFSPLPGSGIAIRGGNNNSIMDNEIAVIGLGVVISGDSAIQGTVVSGNRIGLVESTKSANGYSGILVANFDAASKIRDTKILQNAVAGSDVGIWITNRKGVEGMLIEGNTVGITAGEEGDTPRGMTLGKQRFGIRLDGAVEVDIRNNTIAGHSWNLLVAGNSQFEAWPVVDENGDEIPDEVNIEFLTPLDPEETEPFLGSSRVMVEKNTIGLNPGRRAPSGKRQIQGITVYSQARSVLLKENTVAGHEGGEIWIQEGFGHSVVGNRIGSGAGTSRGSRIGVFVENALNTRIGPDNVIGYCSEAGVQIAGLASGTHVFGNKIGTNVFGTIPWPNGVGIRVADGEGGDAATNIVIDRNLISGNTGSAISVDFAGDLDVTTNRIGVSNSGAALPNGSAGVLVENGSVAMLSNTIAHNKVAGVRIPGGDNSVSIRSGVIYENGDGQGENGIFYDRSPLSPPRGLVGFRTLPNRAKRVAVIFGLPRVSRPGQNFADENPVLEIWGNRSEPDTQGRVLLVSESIDPQKPFVLMKEFSSSIPMKNFTATLTYKGRTSAFSSHTMGEFFRRPELNFGPSDGDSITLIWPDSPFFMLQTFNGKNPFWEQVQSEIVQKAGWNTVTLSIQDDVETEMFRLALDEQRLFE